MLDAVLASQPAVPGGLVGGRDARLFSVYRTAYQARLREVMRSDHPATARVLGAAFEDLSAAFVLQRPSNAWSLRHAGSGFPAFVAKRAPHDRAALGELAKFERLLLDVFDAATGPRLQRLERPSSVLESVHFHPSVRRFGARYNVVEQWHAQRRDEPVPQWQALPSQWVLWRSRDQRSSFRAIDPAEALFIDLLRAGTSFADSLGALAEQVDIATVPRIAMDCLERWANDGLLSGLAASDGP